MSPRLGRGQWLLRVLMVVLPLAALFATAPAGDVPLNVLLPVVAAASVLWAALPGSQAGLVALAGVVGWWASAPDPGLDPMALVAAACLLGAHIAGLMAAAGPRTMPIDPDWARLWLIRGMAAMLAALAAYGVIAWAAWSPSPPLTWMAGALVGCGLLVGGLWALRPSSR